MAELRRLGELVAFSSEYRSGDARHIHGLDNLGAAILFPDEKLLVEDYYLTSTLLKSVAVAGLGKIEIGDYEGSILDKLLFPAHPVICISGRIGSGKTTTMRYVMQHYVEKIGFGTQGIGGSSVRRLTVWVDFSHMLAEQKATLHDMLGELCTQLWSRCIYLVDDRYEFDGFWSHLEALSELGHDRFVDEVVGPIHGEYPELRDIKPPDEREIAARKGIKAKLKSSLIWYLRYLILLYRYLIQVSFAGHRECALIVLDNVDSLETSLQRSLVRIVTGCAHQQGPTFVILVRTETFERSGLNDVLRDVVAHQGPEPYNVVIDRLERFLRAPEKYFGVAQTLTPEERSQTTWYLSRILPKLRRGRVYRDFVRSVAGKNIRNALVLAQSIFQLTTGEMKLRDLTATYLVRAMVRFGRAQYRSYQNPRITNPFDVEGSTDGRFLTKIRLLRYVAGRGGVCRSPVILGTFALFGHLDLASPHDTVSRALEELLRNECQLLTSNGVDAYHITPDDDQDDISITEIGRGYIDQLIFNIHFVQEVMLDARVPANFPLPHAYSDGVAEKIDVMVNFLKRVYQSELDDIAAFRQKGIVDYAAIFQPRLISLDIICRTCKNTEELLQSRKLRKRKDLQLEYEEVLINFRNLMFEAMAGNNRLFGVADGIVAEPE